MIRLNTDRPLIFEHAARGLSRQSWIALTAASWGFFLYLLLPAVGSFVVAGVQHIGNPASLFAFVNDSLFGALTAYGKLGGGTLALALGITSLDRIVRHKPMVIDTDADPINRHAPTALIVPDPAERFDAQALVAMRSAQRLIAHHDPTGQLVAVTLLARRDSGLNELTVDFGAAASEKLQANLEDRLPGLSDALPVESHGSRSPDCAVRSDYPKPRLKRAARKSGR